MVRSVIIVPRALQQRIIWVILEAVINSVMNNACMNIRTFSWLGVDYQPSWALIIFMLTFSCLCVRSQQLLPVVLMGPSKHAMSPVCFMLELLEEVRRAQDANQIGWRAAWTQPQQHGTNTHTPTVFILQTTTLLFHEDGLKEFNHQFVFFNDVGLKMSKRWRQNASTLKLTFIHNKEKHKILILKKVESQMPLEDVVLWSKKGIYFVR